MTTTFVVAICRRHAQKLILQVDASQLDVRDVDGHVVACYRYGLSVGEFAM